MSKYAIFIVIPYLNEANKLKDRQKTDFHVVPKQITVSSRKYDDLSWLRVQLTNLSAFSLFLLKVKPASIKSLYLNLLNQKSGKNNSI